MYKNQYISELPINEVKEYFDELRCNTPWTAEQFADFEMCKERLVVYACKTLEQTNLLDKIRAEIEQEYTKFRNRSDMWYERACGLGTALEIIDKYKAESEAAEL